MKAQLLDTSSSGLRTMVAVFETGVRYQLVHALALLLVAAALARTGGWALRGAGWCFAAGILVFSGSLYVLALSGVRTWGAITTSPSMPWARRCASPSAIEPASDDSMLAVLTQ